jgi:hypothetical protein
MNDSPGFFDGPRDARASAVVVDGADIGQLLRGRFAVPRLAFYPDVNADRRPDHFLRHDFRPKAEGVAESWRQPDIERARVVDQHAPAGQAFDAASGPRLADVRPEQQAVVDQRVPHFVLEARFLGHGFGLAGVFGLHVFAVGQTRAPSLPRVTSP